MEWQTFRKHVRLQSVLQSVPLGREHDLETWQAPLDPIFVGHRHGVQTPPRPRCGVVLNEGDGGSPFQRQRSQVLAPGLVPVER